MRVLEPSAGTGRILEAMPGLLPRRFGSAGGTRQTACEVIAVEINQQLSTLLERLGLASKVVQADFLSCGAELGKFDRILMNPPFDDGADIAHITHAVDMLKPGGILIAICAGGPRQREKLLPLVEKSGGTWEPLPAGTFKESGTMVSSVLLTYYA